MDWGGRRIFMVKDSDIIIGYAGKCYSILDLRERAKEYRYGENISIKESFESKFNNPNESSLDGEVWVRLTQKGWNSYFVSNFGRVRWINNENKIFQLHQVDELKEDGTPHYGYLVFDPKQLPGIIQHNYHVWRLIAMGFLGLSEHQKGYIVHHINNNGYDCSPENLILVTEDQHKAIHPFLK